MFGHSALSTNIFTRQRVVITQGQREGWVGGVVFSFKINISCVSYSIIKYLKGVVLPDLFTKYFSDDYIRHKI